MVAGVFYGLIGLSLSPIEGVPLMQTQAREVLHAQYLAARSVYKPKADYVHSASYIFSPAVVDACIFTVLSLSVGFLLNWIYGTEPAQGFILIGIALILYQMVVRWRGWKVSSYRSWYLQRFQPIREQHQAAFEALLASSVPRETLASWQHEPLRSRAVYQLAGYEIVYDAVEDHFRIRDVNGLDQSYFGTYEQALAFLKGRVMQVGLCSE